MDPQDLAATTRLRLPVLVPAGPRITDDASFTGISTVWDAADAGECWCVLVIYIDIALESSVIKVWIA